MDMRVHVELICSMMDQPERRGSNYMMGGNSIYGARWGYSINLQAVLKKLVPCATCQERLFRHDDGWNATTCLNCSQWEMIRDDGFLSWDAPKGFPSLEDGNHSVSLKPMKLDYGIFMEAATTTHNKVVRGTWSKTEAEAFLAYHCINNKAATQIIRNAQNMRALSSLADNEECKEEYDLLVAQQTSSPDEFAPWKFPSIWTRGVPLTALIDAPMHLLFLGAVQGITGFIHSWLRKHGKYSNFMRLVESRLNGFGKFKLSWLRMLPYKGDRLGGWVSENYVSFSRVCRWFFLILDDLKPDEDLYKDPVTSPKTWKLAENKGWLRARGLPYDGKAKDLKERVAECMSSGRDIPLLPPPEGSMDDLHALIASMYDMVKSIMAFEVTEHDVTMADFHVKLFLTRLVDCDKKINPGSKIPFWISSYTYPCLLNFPAHMKEFGPLKNLWEGGVRGEGYLRLVKPLHGTVGLRHGWAVQIMNRIHQKKGLRAIGTSMESDDALDEEDIGEKMDVRNSCWAYPDSDDIFRDYKTNQPLCLAYTKEGKYGALLRKGNMIEFDFLTKKSVLIIRGIEFFDWRPCDLVEVERSSVVFSCILLPIPTIKDGTSLYAAVREDYTMLSGTGEFK